MALYKAEIVIPINNEFLQGILQIPDKSKRIVIFVHGSGSSRLSVRNQHVADMLNQANIATLLFDLLLPEEERVDEVTREYRFNIELLSERLVAVTDWLHNQPGTKTFTIGYFGASTGAGAALQAAAKRQKLINAVVSRGGRPDLAGEALSLVKAPTLLIVGGLDKVVIDLNNEAKAQMHGKTKMDIVPGATHLFEESGTLDQVARLAIEWFDNYL